MSKVNIFRLLGFKNSPNPNEITKFNKYQLIGIFGAIFFSIITLRNQCNTSKIKSTYIDDNNFTPDINNRKYIHQINKSPIIIGDSNKINIEYK